VRPGSSYAGLRRRIAVRRATNSLFVNELPAATLLWRCVAVMHLRLCIRINSGRSEEDTSWGFLQLL
jgi:hypothetical protein